MGGGGMGLGKGFQPTPPIIPYYPPTINPTSASYPRTPSRLSIVISLEQKLMVGIMHGFNLWSVNDVGLREGRLEEERRVSEGRVNNRHSHPTTPPASTDRE